MDNHENAIEWLTGTDQATVSLTDRRFITQIKKLAEVSHEVTIHTNKDGSICAQVPKSYISVRKPRKLDLSEDQRKELADRLARSVKKSK